MDARATVVPPSVDDVLEALRTLDRLGPNEIARVLPELDHARARLWLRMLMSNQTSPTVPGEPTPEVLTVKEVADQLRFSTGHVYELVRSGRLRSIRDHRTIRITPAALAEWRTMHEVDSLDGRRRGSGESLLQDEPRADADRPPLQPERAPGRRGRRPMTRSR
jgi:excisionase family DNA binding protein